MFNLRVSTLKLVRRFPFSQVTTISCIQRFDCERFKSYPEPGNGYNVPARRLHQGEKTMADRFSLEKIKKEVVLIMREVKMKDLASVPTPMFWMGVSGLAPMLGIPLMFMVTGYSTSLATVQLMFGATICSFLGGARWGYLVSDVKPPGPGWETVLWSVAPQTAAWFALLLPHSLGLLLIAGSIGMSTFIDLLTAHYPPWFRSLRLFLAIPAIIGLLLTFIMRPFA